MRAVVAAGFQNSILETQPLHGSSPIQECKGCISLRREVRGIREPDFIDLCEIGEPRSQFHYFPVDLVIRKAEVLT
jgi:hypothetical protein